MKITKIETQKKNSEKANIYVDDKFSFSITLNGLVEYGLCEGLEVSNEQIERIKEKDEPKLAFLQSLCIISYGMKTESELKKKLREKKFSDTAIEYAIESMKSYSYINDEEYVKSYLSSRAIPQHWGKQKIVGNLLQKGVPMEIIKEGMSLYDEEMQKESVLIVAEKYCRAFGDMDKRKKKEKLYRHLASKGFSYDLISYAISKTLSDDDA